MTSPAPVPDGTAQDRNAQPHGEDVRPLPHTGRTGGLRTIDPDLALRPGRFDPAALLVVWIMRRSFIPLIMLGTLLALAVSDSAEPPPELSSPTEIASVLLTPWVGVAIAVLVRLSASVLAWVLAVPLTEAARPRNYDGMASTRWVRAATDRLRLARAYRELRWTWPVRKHAAERSGTLGARLLLVDRAVTVIMVIIVVGLPLALVVESVTTG